MCKDGNERLTLKIAILISTTLYLICGMFLFIFGVVMLDPNMNFTQHRKIKPFDFNIIQNNILQSSPIFSIIYGLIVMTTSCYGFAVLIKELSDGIKIYWISIIVAFVIGLVYLGVASFFPSLKIVKSEMKKTIIGDFEKQDIHVITGNQVVLPTDANGLSWSRTQLMAGCCGIDGPFDYAYLTEDFRNETFPDGRKVLVAPLSCCKTKNIGQIAKFTNDFVDFLGCVDGNYSSFNKQPCYIPPQNYTWMNFAMAMGLGWTSFGLQIRMFFNIYSFLQLINWTPTD